MEKLKRDGIEHPSYSSISFTNMEYFICNEQMGKAENNKLDKKFCINIHSKRKRLADPDGISGKALIDGLAEGRVFADDSSKYIKEVSFTQEITKEEEETIIDIVEI